MSITAHKTQRRKEGGVRSHAKALNEVVLGFGTGFRGLRAVVYGDNRPTDNCFTQPQVQSNAWIEPINAKFVLY